MRTSNVGRTVLLAFALVAAGAGCDGCSDDPEPGTTDAGATKDAGSAGDAGATSGGTACYVETQQRCHEYPEPTGDQRDNLAVECSSVSGALGATCPQAGYLGKCTIGTGPGREIKRVYTGADAAYEADFCATVALGVWSTAF